MTTQMLTYIVGRPYLRPLYRDCHMVQGIINQGFLRGGRRRAPADQRHGDRGGLDERRLIHFHCRHDRFFRV